MAPALPVLLAAYALGCLSGAYYLVRLWRGEDVRRQGSGAAGATNAARVLGRRGFALVFGWDMAKGALAVLLGRWAGLEGWALGATVLAVTAGHVWPVQLGFRGGRGVATAFAAFLAYVPWIGLLEGASAALGALLLRRVTEGGLVGILFGVGAAFAIRGVAVETAVLALTVGLIAFTHRRYLARLCARMTTPRPASAPALTFRVATAAADFEQIARLNYQTFVEEIPQHAPNAERVRVDPLLEQSTCFACLEGERLVGMLAVSGRRPFSLDRKLEDLDRFLPEGCRAPCEVRLLAVEPEHRGGRVAAGLIATMRRHCEEQGYDTALISAAESQRKLYAHLGFVPFGPPIGTPEAPYRGMYITWDRLSRSVERIGARLLERGEANDA